MLRFAQHDAICACEILGAETRGRFSGSCDFQSLSNPPALAGGGLGTIQAQRESRETCPVVGISAKPTSMSTEGTSIFQLSCFGRFEAEFIVNWRPAKCKGKDSLTSGVFSAISTNVPGSVWGAFTLDTKPQPFGRSLRMKMMTFAVSATLLALMLTATSLAGEIIFHVPFEGDLDATVAGGSAKVQYELATCK